MSKSFFNFCPNCKSEDFSFENDFKFHCTSCDFVLYHNIAAAVAVIIIHDNKILFTVRNVEPDKGKWDLPGGFIDPNENAEEAACRELKEELGIDLLPKNLKYITTAPNNYLYKNVPYRTMDIFYEYEVNSNQINISSEDEINELIWVTKEKIQLDKIGFVSIRKVIEENYKL